MIRQRDAKGRFVKVAPPAAKPAGKCSVYNCDGLIIGRSEYYCPKCADELDYLRNYAAAKEAQWARESEVTRISKLSLAALIVALLLILVRFLAVVLGADQ